MSNSGKGSSLGSSKSSPSFLDQYSKRDETKLHENGKEGIPQDENSRPAKLKDGKLAEERLENVGQQILMAVDQTKNEINIGENTKSFKGDIDMVLDEEFDKLSDPEKDVSGTKDQNDQTLLPNKKLGSKQNNNASVRPKVPFWKVSNQSNPNGVRDEEKSPRNNTKRNIFSSSKNPFLQTSSQPQSRRTARRFSELDPRQAGLEMPGWQRKLSLLFVPPSQEELQIDAGDSTELLPGGDAPTIVASNRTSRSSKKKTKHAGVTANKKISKVSDNIKSSGNLSDDNSASSSDEGAPGSTRRSELSPLMDRRSRPGTTSSPDGEVPAYEDSICSNRSAYFKRFYRQSGNFDAAEQQPSNFNSIASLVREKNKMPAVEEKKKKPPEDYQNLALSIILLTIIVILITLIYHYYHLHILSVFIFDRIKIVEADRVMEVMSVDDESGYRAPLVKIRLGVEFPVNTAHTDCTDYLTYLIDVIGESNDPPQKRKRRSFEGTVRSLANRKAALSSISPTEQLRSDSLITYNKLTDASRREKRSTETKVTETNSTDAIPSIGSDKLEVAINTTSDDEKLNEVEDDTESSDVWFNNMLAPAQAVMETLPTTTTASLISEDKIHNSDLLIEPILAENDDPKSKPTPQEALDQKPTIPARNPNIGGAFDDRNHVNGDAVAGRRVYVANEASAKIDRGNTNYMIEAEEEAVSVEDFPYGIYETDPFQFGDHFSDMQCVDFKNKARLQLTHRPPLDDVDCFSVHWESSSSDLVMKDCFIMDKNTTGVWWGVGDVTGGAMPLTKLDKISETALYSGQIQQNAVGGLLRRIWISSEGILVSIPFAAGAKLSVNALHEPSREFCLLSENDVDFNHPNVRKNLNLDYTLCTAPKVASLLSKLSDIERMDSIEYATSKWHKSLHPLPDDVELIHTPAVVTSRTLREVADRFLCPIWRPWISKDESSIDQDDVIAYVESIASNLRNTCGYVLLPVSWQTKLGTLEFDYHRFPNPNLLMERLNRKGLKLALTLSSLIDVEIAGFTNSSIMDLLIRQINSTLPILVPSSKTKSAAVLDFTNPNTVEWYSSQLIKLKDKYGINSFHLSPTSTQSLPPYRKFYSAHPNPDYAIRQFITAVSRVKAPISTNTAIIPVDAPTFLTVSYVDSSWDMLEMLPNRIITISAVGGNLVDAGVVGGWSTQPGQIPSRELYVRWMGVSAFLPAMEISVLPSMYDSAVVAKMNDLMRIREELVIPRFRKNLNESITNNYPLVSPLALKFPKDLKSLSIGDQWIVGEDLMVAPVLKRGARSRDIYLPPGIWKDILYDKLLKGKRWLKNHRVAKGKVPYFLLVNPERGPKSQRERKEKSI
ncbi:uncharacterized protein LOC108671600 isoform X2 [Hyalella azteca]|uniref:Uncharacterized protein LOC108671600 isoform X2 n=1 Tax=Hyalella azteca TaxID=294128 RepID=A0A8B7NLV8_HYAAZ|nr:uncharacterized protein LOC108671600 isoform X2 [Hyalella azteca]